MLWWLQLVHLSYRRQNVFERQIRKIRLTLEPTKTQTNRTQGLLIEFLWWYCFRTLLLHCGCKRVTGIYYWHRFNSLLVLYKINNTFLFVWKQIFSYLCHSNENKFNFINFTNLSVAVEVITNNRKCMANINKKYWCTQQLSQLFNLLIRGQ